MSRRPHPTVLEHLAIGGLKPEILAEFRDRHRKRTACRCELCRSFEPVQTPAAVGPGTGGRAGQNLTPPVPVLAHQVSAKKSGEAE